MNKKNIVFNINIEDFHVYYPGEDKIYINGILHKVPKKVRGTFPYLIIKNKEVYINGWVYNLSSKTWHLSALKQIFLKIGVLFIILTFILILKYLI